jgi:hypothetical protein
LDIVANVLCHSLVLTVGHTVHGGLADAWVVYSSWFAAELLLVLLLG